MSKRNQRSEIRETEQGTIGSADAFALCFIFAASETAARQEIFSQANVSQRTVSCI